MNRKELFEQIKLKQSYLCVGLDTDINKLPAHLLKCDDPVLEFNKKIIEYTQDLCVSYKPNIAFYESLGSKGWVSLEKTIELIPKEIFTISDAKRGDIGNTSGLYARAFFQNMNFDSVTVAPYMGVDSVEPFLEYKDKWVILLGLTSNGGSADFQNLDLANGKKLYQEVITKSQSWGKPDNLMYVIGATKADAFKEIRALAPDYFFLVPGVGAQGGDLQALSQYGMNDHCGLLVNSSRGIIYASNGEDFAEKAREEALKIQQEMAILLDKYL
jgi:orotidine-5'-phosphate decarboxylase